MNEHRDVKGINQTREGEREREREYPTRAKNRGFFREKEDEEEG